MILKNNIYFKIKKHLSKSQFIDLNLFIFFSIISMFLEMLGIGLIIPIIKILSQDQIFFTKFVFLNDYNLNQYTKFNLVLFSLSILLIIYTFKTIFLTFISYKQGKLLTDIKRGVSEKLFNTYLNRPYQFFLNNNSYELIRNINDVQIFISLLNSLLNLITEIFILVGISLLLVFYEPVGSITSIIIIGFFGFLFSSKLKKKAEFWGEQRRDADGLKLNSMQESFRLIQEIKILKLSKYFISKFVSSNNLSAINQFKHQFVLSLPKYWFELLAIFGFTILILVLAYFDDNSKNILATLGLFAAATFRLLPSIIRSINSFQNIHFCSPVLNNLLDEFNNKNNKSDQNKIDVNRKILMTKEIHLKDVSFKYENSDIKILDNINLKIDHGSSVGIMGPSGVGKTTLINIILGLLRPSSGTIFVDGVDIYKNLNSWQNNIGYVPQNIILIDNKLRNNIALGVEEIDIDEDKIEKCVKEAQLDSFIQDKKKLDTYVGELGSRLSGGQKQRIGIARSLYNDPQILILDEFTNALDFLTEEKIISQMRNLNKKTIIMISHKLTTVSQCDKVYELNKSGLKII
tara:strand:+ start:55 stop:1779 length:1725 start_codon:yes stop_codon:yes gene_type:complete